MTFLKEFTLEAKGTKLVLQENVLAVLSEEPLSTVSSAFYNGGGIKKTRGILNIEVPKNYGDGNLHADPDVLVADSSKKIGVQNGFISMVTAACVRNFALASKRVDGIGVSVIATAADDAGNTCNFAEASGEEMNTHDIGGTINIIVLIDGNPTESCLVGNIITATEAKTAAMLELDIRSRYTGDVATGTITDAIVVAETGRGEPIVYGGPASPLGQLVGYCTKKAVKEAIAKGKECSPHRSLLSRLDARHLSIRQLAFELSKAKSLNVDKQELAALFSQLIREDAVFASAVLAAVKLNEEFEKGLLPPQFSDLKSVGRDFGALLSKQNCTRPLQTITDADADAVGLPPFLKFALLELAKNALARREN
ncbi:MAG: adenosylcobinamide amidohydrolase [Candidatus Bathyarchaeota archaeon]|nr:adenosylcobinamide amidohydrolase [Candidatus Bathyarchaeota archaeon]